MPTNSEKQILYSSKELAKILGVTPIEVTNFIEAKNFPKSALKREYYIEKDSLSSFFEEFFTYRNILPKYYELPEYLKECTSPWAVTLVKIYQEKFTRPTCMSPDQGKFLRNLVVEVKPNNVLEIGCYIGVSTIWMASGLEELNKNGVIHSIDLFRDIMPSHRDIRYIVNPLEFAQKSVLSAQLSHRVKFYKMNSRMLGKQFNQLINKPIEFLFIDGDHSIYGCLSDFILLYNHVPRGGYIILHDINPEFCGYKGPRYVIEKYIKPSPDFDLVEIETTPRNFGIAVIRKLKDNKELYSAAYSELRIRAVMDRIKRAIWPKIKDKLPGDFIKTFTH